MIRIDGLVKKYAMNGISVTALDGVSLAVGSGEFTALAGPSGSGKTTLLNIIGGLDRPTMGAVWINETEIGKLSPREIADFRLYKIGFIFQAYNLIPVLTSLENVEYILLLQGIDRESRRKRSIRILQEVGLGKEINRLPRELSGGQQQRVAVARAIVSEPDIILADEPTANLDQKTGGNLLDLMRGLNREKKITFLFSTHDMMVMERSDRVIHMIDGKIQA